MIGILSIFAVLGICLVISIILATNTLSALRAYGSLQTHWTEARKEATFQLVNYVRTGEPRHVTRFDNALELIRNARDARIELLNADTDKEKVRKNLLETHTVPGDVDKMIRTFERFHDFQDFRKTVTGWINSDSMITDMEEIAGQIQSAVVSGPLTEAQKQEQIRRITSLDRELTGEQYRLAVSLASGTDLLNRIILWVSSSLGLILLLTGSVLSFRFLKSIKNWRQIIELSEQKYRSLFEQNPNAVYSLTRDGRFVTGNKGLEKLIGYSFDKLKGKTFDHLVEHSELKKVRRNFEKAAEGTPVAYETIGIRENGEQIYTDVTNIPIYVDGEIIGVFGIAQDITGRKKAERQVKEQLEEKTHLLTEVHDRVKNNLALITSLIQLQKDMADIDGAEKYLDSTISRIQSMAMVHERLYHSGTFSRIRMDEYVKELSETIRSSPEYDTDRFQLDINTEPVTLNIKKAVPTGILLNELLHNAFSYAFEGLDNGRVGLELSQVGNEIILKVSDDGVGLPDHVDPETADTMGMQLINVLSKQLQGSLKVASENGTGTSYIIRFPVQSAVESGA